MGYRGVFALCVVTVLLMVYAPIDLRAAESGGGYEDYNVVIGAGIAYMKFSETDEFRRSTGLFGDKDTIEYITGFQFYAELFFNDTFSLNLPFGLAAGYRFQILGGGYEYSTVGGSSVERMIEIKNHIAYMDISIPVDQNKYWLIGGTAGIGLSSYEASWEYSDASISDVHKSSSGIVVPIGVFLDWGADGFGGRLGITYHLSKYGDIDDYTPKGNGVQLNLDVRYAI